MQAFETFDDATARLTITNSTEFDERGEYSNDARHVVIEGGVSETTEKALSWWLLLASVVIGDSVISIGSYAFASCSNLETVIIGGSVKTIGNYRFFYVPH